MRTILEKVVREKLSRFPQARGALHFLKFSTVTSGSRIDDKVIFLVFAGGAPLPFLCIKTVRNYESKGVVEKNFANLRMLHEVAERSGYGGLFARPLHLYDDGESVASFETACTGRKLPLTRPRITVVLNAYTGFHASVAKGAELVPGETWEEQMPPEVRSYLASLPQCAYALPRIPQHADLTADNMLWEGDRLHIIDYDYAGTTELAGFDLFGLLRRFDPENIRSLCETLLPGYFEAIGATVPHEAYPRLLFIYHGLAYAQKAAHDGKELNVPAIIADFRRSYPQL